MSYCERESGPRVVRQFNQTLKGRSASGCSSSSSSNISNEMGCVYIQLVDAIHVATDSTGLRRCRFDLV